MKSLILFFLLIGSLSCRADEDQLRVGDGAIIDGIPLEILNGPESCWLRYHIGDAENVVALQPSPPCFFLTRGHPAPQLFRYPEFGGKAVVIVAGTAASTAVRNTWNLPEDLICGTVKQGIVIKSKSVTATKSTLRGGIACKEKGADEKDFRMFARE